MSLFFKFFNLQYSVTLVFLILLVSILEFFSYGIAYPIISIFLDFDNSLLLKFNNFISSNLGFNFEISEKILLTLLIFVLLFQSITFVLFRFVTLKITLNYLLNLRSKIFNQFFDSSYNPNVKISEILNSLTIQSMNAFLFWNSYIECFKRILIIVSILILFIIISFKVLLISTLLIGFILILINKISSLSKKYGKNMTLIDQKYLNTSSQSLGNYRYIKITNIKEKLFTSIEELLKNFNSNQFKFTMLSKLIKESSEPIAVIIIIIIGYISSYYLNISISLLIISILLLRRLIANISSLFNSYQSLLKNRESLIYVERIIKNFEIDKSFKFYTKTSFADIKFTNVHYWYSKNKIIFKDLNILIKKNEPTVIYGKSGSGKSSLINLMTGITKPSKGHIYLNGDDINSKNYKKRIKIGLVSQDEVIFNMSLLDNLLLRNPKAKKTRIIELIKSLGLETIFQNKKINLEMTVNEISSNLSGGEKQRISLIREILIEPDILILDEATSALDNVSLKKTINFLNKIKNKTTLIIFTHQKEFKNFNFKIYELKKNNIFLKK